MDQTQIDELDLGKIVLLDRINELDEPDVLYSFALDELLCRQTGQGGPAVCHIWRHPKGLVMGLRDSRLPSAAEAERRFVAEGWSTAVRNSGGAAVPLDSGVINISLIMPKPVVDSFHFHNDFERMYNLIRHVLRGTGYRVDKGEIKGAYCPGEFDLSINGLKFCGIAQRRQTHAFIVQAFIVAAGDGQERARLVRTFYDQAAAGAAANEFPLVIDNRTASLEQLTGLGAEAGIGAVQAFVNELKQVVMLQQLASGMITEDYQLELPARPQILAMADVLRSRYAIEAR
ncbi:lipoate--protein ligase family protein [Paenibacillus sinopodophylli]|uniref:lipoate--protein ligase family protein n=1 Tax=Paenibacillus sinopodophylli TaxID=1837342 RepID=UPI00110CF481|nr:lipoate--protein ligase family protein [Paenibacillus sinopodophylli]